MAITEKLNQQWTIKEQSEAVFQFRAAAQNCYMTIVETVDQLDTLIASAKFTTVDAEIKSDGAAVRNAISSAKEALDAKADFINWKQPLV